MTSSRMVYPLGGSYIKICWANGVVIMSFKRWVVAPRANSFKRSWGSQTTEDKGRAIPHVTSIQGNLICCRLPGFEYTRDWGSSRQVQSASLIPSVISILGNLGSNGWRPLWEFKMVWGVDQEELHDLKAPPRCHCLVGLNDATFECEHANLWVVSTTRHFLALAT